MLVHLDPMEVKTEGRGFTVHGYMLKSCLSSSLC